MEPKRTKSKASSKESHLAMLIVKTRNPIQTQPLESKAEPKCKKSRRNTAKPAQTKLLASNSSPGCEKSSTEAKDSKRATLLKKVTDSALMWSGAGNRKPTLMGPNAEDKRSAHPKVCNGSSKPRRK
jgi:hypothetical protein